MPPNRLMAAPLGLERSPDALPWADVAGPLVAAEDAIARLDERERTSPVQSGHACRMHLRDACASLWVEGALVPIEDLVLHDHAMDIRSPTHDLVRAHAVLRTRRRLAREAAGTKLTLTRLEALVAAAAGADAPRDDRGPRPDAPEPDDDAEDFEAAVLSDEEAATFATVDALLRRPRPSAVARSEFVYDESFDQAARLAAWHAGLDTFKDLPPVLAAALAYDTWQGAPPLEHHAWLGRLLAPSLLRSAGKTRTDLFALNIGLKATRWRWSANRGRTANLVGLIEAMRVAADQSLKELDRLALARELLLRKCQGRRTHSRLPDLVALLLEWPLVTTPLVTKTLHISQQAAAILIADLAPNLREITGRGRYRAWAVI